jgi:uncharacterized protein YndB with AHSA1/START domain
MSISDRIEKDITLRAPVARVWRAIADAQEFGRWFGFTIYGTFEEGKSVRGRFEGSLDEAAIMEEQRRLGVTPSKVVMPPENAVFCTVQRMVPESYFSFRWIPYGIDAAADLEKEVTTLVEFRLEAVPEGTRLTIVESGFDAVSPQRRARAFRMNEGGWAAQAENVKRYVESA